MVIDSTGGLHGVRDRQVLLLLEDLPGQSVFGAELYSSVFDKAAVYARTIIMGHPFLDGNKRTGMSAAVVFLEDNGGKFSAKEGEVEHFALEIIRKKHDIPVIAKWLKTRTKQM